MLIVLKQIWIAVIIIGALSASFVFIGDIGTVANISVFAIIMVFVLVNLALIWLRYKQPDAERQFRSPVNVKKFPVLAALGIITPILGIIQFEPFVLLMGLGVLASGASFYYKVGGYTDGKAIITSTQLALNYNDLSGNSLYDFLLNAQLNYLYVQSKQHIELLLNQYHFQL